MHPIHVARVQPHLVLMWLETQTKRRLMELAVTFNFVFIAMYRVMWFISEMQNVARASAYFGKMTVFGKNSPRTRLSVTKHLRNCQNLSFHRARGPKTNTKPNWVSSNWNGIGVD